MRVRDLGPDDLPAYRRLRSQAFGGPAAPQEPRPLTEQETALGIDSAELPGGLPGVLAGGAILRHDAMVLGGAEVPCAGIASLAVHPAHRRGGVFSQLLEATLRRARDEGFPVAMLFPSAPDLYRRHGFQVITRVRAVQLPTANLQGLRLPAGKHLAPVTDATFSRLRSLYRESLVGQNGLLLREGPLYGDGRHPGGFFDAVLVEDADGEATGYVSWTRPPRGHDATLEVHDLVGRTAEDRLALLAALGSWSTVVDRIQLRLRSDDPVLDQLPGPGQVITTPLACEAMLRVIDPAQVLTRRGAPTDLQGCFVLEVEDPLLGSSALVVRVEEGSVTCRDTGPTDAALPRAVLDLRAAGLLLAGGSRVARADRLGLGVHADAEACALLDRLLEGPPPTVMDVF